MPVTVDRDMCIGCGACTGVCPNEALTLDEEGKSVCDSDKCVECGACVATCPVGAITQ